jgi:hypothetical protein
MAGQKAGGRERRRTPTNAKSASPTRQTRLPAGILIGPTRGSFGLGLIPIFVALASKVGIRHRVPVVCAAKHPVIRTSQGLGLKVRLGRPVPATSTSTERGAARAHRTPSTTAFPRNPTIIGCKTLLLYPQQPSSPAAADDNPGAFFLSAPPSNDTPVTAASISAPQRLLVP